MFDEFLLEVFSIRIKIKGYLENTTEKSKETYDIKGIQNKNKITYIYNDIKHVIDIFSDKVFLSRESQDFIHKLSFTLNKETNSEYYIKEYGTSIEIKVITTELNITENHIKINYKIIDTGEEYEYLIEMEK